jgi:major vault protein
LFKSNNLVVTNVDIQSLEPYYEKTKAMLQESVTLAIDITTKMQEQEATRISQKKA